MILWCDIETTGLSLDFNEVIELGFILTDDQLNEWATFRTPILPVLPLDQYSFSVGAMKLHGKSGLMAELTDLQKLPYTEISQYYYPAVQRRAIEWIQDNGAEDLPLAGSTINFDRSFLQRKLPKLEECFHYRNLDVTTIKNLARIWRPEVKFENAGLKTHRVLDDIRASITELKFYRDKGFINVVR